MAEPEIVPTIETAVPVFTAPAVEAAVRPEPPRLDPKKYLESAGLQMVETKAGSVAVQTAAPEEAKLGRPRRQRSEAPAEEPLVQVETRK